MADDAYDERLRQHEAIMEGLARMLAAQHAMNQRQDGINERLTLAIERIDHGTTLVDPHQDRHAVRRERRLVASRLHNLAPLYARHAGP